jgi:hypothetical protein
MLCSEARGDECPLSRAIRPFLAGSEPNTNVRFNKMHSKLSVSYDNSHHFLCRLL